MLLWGAVEPGGACFISGLPGGISYFMLGLIKLGKMDAMLEKRITANLNCWLRVPGILLSSFVVYQAILYGKHSVPLWPAMLQVVLPFYNCLFYCKQAVANCAHPSPALECTLAPACRHLPDVRSWPCRHGALHDVAAQAGREDVCPHGRDCQHARQRLHHLFAEGNQGDMEGSTGGTAARLLRAFARAIYVPL